MLKRIKIWPAEIFLLVIPSVFWLLYLFIISWPQLFNSHISFKPLFFTDFIAGNKFLFVFIILMSEYLWIKICWFILNRRKNKLIDDKFWLEFIKLVKSLVIYILCLSFCLNVIRLWVIYLEFNSQPDKILDYSQLFMSWDYRIFSFYPGFRFGLIFADTLLEKLTIISYGSLISVFFLFLILTVLLDKKTFRRLITSFILAPIISIPFWFAFPALSPSWLYWQNIYSFNLDKKLITADVANYYPSPQLTDAIKGLKKLWINEKLDLYPVTSNPSMHTSWGLELAYYGTLLWKPLAIVLVPFVFFSTLGTIYTLEHYTIDVMLGLIIAIITIVITNKLTAGKSEETGIFLFFIDVLQKDLKLLIGWLDDLRKRMAVKLKSLIFTSLCNKIK